MALPLTARAPPASLPSTLLPTSTLLATSPTGKLLVLDPPAAMAAAEHPAAATDAPGESSTGSSPREAFVAQHSPRLSDGEGKGDGARLSHDDLVHIQQELLTRQDIPADELVDKAKALVGHALLASTSSPGVSSSSQIDEANATISRLRAELASLPAFYTSRSQLDHDRLQSENDQLRTQAQALARKLAAAEAKGKGKGKERAEDIDEETASQATEVDGEEHEEERDVAELKAENRALTADVHRLQHRLDTAEQQTQRLSHELRSLRAYFLHGSPLVTLEHEVALPSPPASQTSPASPPRGKPRCVTLGDAEAELLLHAGKTLSHVNRVNRVPLSTAIVQQADDIVHAREHGAYSLPLPPALGTGGANEGFDGLMQLANASASSQEEPAAAQPARPTRRLRSVPRRSLAEWDDDAPEDDGGEYIDDTTLPVPPAEFIRDPYAFAPPPIAGPSRLPLGAPQPDADDPDYLPSPPLAGGASRGAPHPRALGQRLSALDVLAQATAEMDVDVPLVSPAGAGTGRKKPPVANSKSRVPAVGPDGEKKPRSPYIKWNIQEDEQLLRAVIQVGCAWDSVAKLCPTRAYHQVRQRFLRGLRSGEQLPKQLLHLQEAVRQSVKEYEAKKKRKRLAKQAAQEIADSAKD
ncbi:hypothetical protein JCM10449v2_001439 [Rhodotorula kratochvilovae]